MSDISSLAIDALRHWRPAGAIAGWGLHPLESTAFSRRTPKGHAATSLGDPKADIGILMKYAF
jgi:hypothetical protein